MVTSNLDRRGRTTVPRSVRKALQLSEGDKIVYIIEGDRVLLGKAGRELAGDPFPTFAEWSDADCVGYADL